MGTTQSRRTPETTAPASAPSQETPRPGRQDRLGNARVLELMKSHGDAPALDDLVDLSPSQAEWIRTLRKLELLNPQATVADLSMALSLKIWSAGQMWDENGKSQYPGLILDYKGGDGYRKVDFGDPRKGGVDQNRLQDWATDQKGNRTNVNHAFPAVAAQAGRGRVAGEYASFMATSGGDTMQNTAETLLRGNAKQWNAGEYKGNLRGESVADSARDRGGKLSELLAGEFRKENRAK